MPIRTTEAEVEAIIAVESTADLTPFIAAASALVDTVVEQDTDGALTDERLLLIETWLAAHFYTVFDPRPTLERAGTVEVSYQSKVGLYLATSHYGQMAMTLDTTGTLRKLSETGVPTKLSLSVTWLGSCRHHHHHH